jgi:perosamine synthetase
MSGYIPQLEPVINAADAKAVSDYMSSGGWLTEFEHSRRFEREIAEAAGAAHCALAPNGTLALFLALEGLGIGAGDEVVVPDLTMAASATAVIMTGARVVFADVDSTTMCIDLADAEARIRESTRAVMVVTLNGRAPVGYRQFISRCRDRGVRVIEDAAQSLGSTLDGEPLGSLADCTCFSFSPHKIVTTGQGGAVVTSDPQLHERMRLLRDFGRRRGGADHYEIVGWNLKFTDMQAVLGVEQIGRLPELVRTKRTIFGHYQDGLADVPLVELPATDLETVTPWFVDVLVPAETKRPLIEYLHARGIGSRPFYPALHAEPAFDSGGSYPVAEDLSARGLWLPSSLSLTEEDVERVCNAVRDFFAGQA